MNTLLHKALGLDKIGNGQMSSYFSNSIKRSHSRSYYLIRVPAFLFGTTGLVCMAANDVKGRHQCSECNKYVDGSCANASLCVWKENAFSRMFNAEPRTLSLTFSMFGARETITSLTSFTVPSMLVKSLEHEHEHEVESKPHHMMSPVSVLILTTPLHLKHGLESPKKKWIDRLDFTKREYFQTACAKLARLFPAYGMLGVIITHAKTTTHDLVSDNYREYFCIKDKLK